MDTALLIVRLIVGLAMFAHGTQKLFGWFGGYGIAGTGGFMETLGFRPGNLFATAAGLAEAIGGLLILLGLGGPLGPAIIILVMVVAATSVHLKNGFFAPGGFELNTVYGAVSLLLAFSGPGAFSLDRAFGIAPFAEPAQTWIIVAIAIVLGLLNLAMRRPAPQTS